MNDSPQLMTQGDKRETTTTTATATMPTMLMPTTTVCHTQNTATSRTSSMGISTATTIPTKKQLITAAVIATAATSIITGGTSTSTSTCSSTCSSNGSGSGSGNGASSSMFVQGATVGAGNGYGVSRRSTSTSMGGNGANYYNRRSPFVIIKNVNKDHEDEDDDNGDDDDDNDNDTSNYQGIVPENVHGYNGSEPQQQRSIIEDSILFGTHCRGGGGGGGGRGKSGGSHDHNKNHHPHPRSKDRKKKDGKNTASSNINSGGANGNGNDDDDDDNNDVHENIERTKLSFSTISQATEKKKTKKKKKKYHDSSSSSSNSKTSTTSTSSSDHIKQKQKQQQQQQRQPPPPPPPPPPSSPFSKENKSHSKNANTFTSSNASRQKPPPPPPPSSSSSSSSSSSDNRNSKEEIIQQILQTNDYYQMLNLDKSSSSSSSSSSSKTNHISITKTQITKAYRKAAVLTHPDKNNGDRKAFDKVREAYDVLKDDIKRKVYDRYGMEGIKNPDLFAAASAAAASSSSSSFGSNSGGTTSSMQEQILKSFFGSSSSSMSGGMFGNSYYSSGGGGGRYNQQKQYKQATNQDVKYELQVSLEDLYNGKQYDLEILLPSTSSSSTLSTSSRTRKTVEVEIPRGMLNQQSIRYSGYVDTIKTSTPADLIFVVKQKHHPTYSRKGFDLVMEVRLSFKEAICGFEREIVHLDGRKIKIRNPYFEGSSGSGSGGIGTGGMIGNSSINEQKKNGPIMISTGDVHVLKGEGMPKFNWAEKKSSHDDDNDDHFDQDEISKQYGDLYVQYIVEMPNTTATSKNGKKFGNDGDDSNDRLTPEERETLGTLLDKLYGTKSQSKSSSYDTNGKDDILKSQTPRRLQVSSASEFGKASGATGNFDEDDHHMVDDHNDDDMFGFERDGFFTRSNSGHRHSSTTSFFSRGFGSGFTAGNFHGNGDGDDDGNVQCQQM